MEKPKKNPILAALFLTMLAVYFGAITYINLCGDPLFYSTDMYTDMMYAIRVWEHRSVFPEGWVFGNQLYVVATPVLTGLIYGLVGDPMTALGVASSVMTVLILLSFDWMLKRITGELPARLLGNVALVGLVLYFGDAVYEYAGWQLLFTMASYYACYAVTAFVSFGCFFRRSDPWKAGFGWMLVLGCLLSFSTGIQSLRQTAVMACPLVAVEALALMIKWLKKEPVRLRPVLVTLALVLSNLLGFAVSRLAAFPSVAVYGQIHLQTLPEMLRDILPSIHTATILLHNSDIWTSVIHLMLLGGALIVLWRYVKGQEEQGGECLLLFVCSLAVILMIDVGTQMFVREIYYFMMYPMAAFLLVMLFVRCPKLGRWGCTAIMLLLFTVNCTQRLPEVLTQEHDQTGIHQVSQYLEDNGYRTVYSKWNNGQKLAVASRCRLKAGFWHAAPLIGTRYLCDPVIFEEDPRHCVYAFWGEQELAEAQSMAREWGLSMEPLKYFPEEDLYLYIAEENLMS